MLQNTPLPNQRLKTRGKTRKDPNVGRVSLNPQLPQPKHNPSPYNPRSSNPICNQSSSRRAARLGMELFRDPLVADPFSPGVRHSG